MNTKDITGDITPLPWSTKRTHLLSENRWYVVLDANDKGPIMDVGGKDLSGQIAEAKYLITDEKEIEANAAYIVKSANNYPEAIEALEEWTNMRIPETNEEWDEFHARIEKTVAIINKAKQSQINH